MNIKSQHGYAMWIADFIGSMLGGMIVTMWLSIVIYYGFDAGSLLCQ